MENLYRNTTIVLVLHNLLLTTNCAVVLNDLKFTVRHCIKIEIHPDTLQVHEAYKGIVLYQFLLLIEFEFPKRYPVNKYFYP